MSNIRSTNLCFNLDKPLYEKAWTYLQNMDKSEFKSYNHAIALAVTEYFKLYYRKESDPYFETREREELFVKQIVLAVEKVIEKALPSFRIACLTGIVQPYKQIETAEPAKEETNNEVVSSFWEVSGGLPPEQVAPLIDENLFLYSQRYYLPITHTLSDTCLSDMVQSIREGWREDDSYPAVGLLNAAK